MNKVFKSRLGFSMLPLIISMFVIVGLLSAGYMLLGPAVNRGKTTETRANLKKATAAIINWAASNGRLPNLSEYSAIIPDPNDAWGRPIIYAYDGNLASTTSGGICGRTSSAFNGTAFLLISGGDDYTISSSPSTSQAFTATPAINPADITRTVSLDELKNRAGCYSSTQGRLRILNNELPTACSGQPYFTSTTPLKIYAAGGITTSYTWTLPTMPGLTFSPASGSISIYGTAPTCPGAYCPSSCVSRADGSYGCPVTFSVTSDETATKTLNLIVKSCNTGVTFSFANNLSEFSAVVKNGSTATKNSDKSVTLGGSSGSTVKSACLWYPQSIDMVNGYFRGYLEFQFADIDHSVTSSSYGDGFVITLMNGGFLPYAIAANTCGTTANGIGYAGLSAGADRNSLAVEFDTYPLTNTTVNDPRTTSYYNHVAVLSGTNVNHTGTTTQTYPFRTPSTSYKGLATGYYNTPAPANWLEDGILHNARIEIVPDCSQGPTGYFVNNNSGENRYYRMTFTSPFATTNYNCSRSSIPNGTLFPTALQPGWTLNTYTSSSCSGTAKSSISFTSAFGPPTVDTNSDGCINLNGTDATCPDTAKKYRIFNNTTAAKYYRVNTGSGTGPCLGPVAAANATSMVPGGEFSPLTPLRTGWALSSYTSAANCTSNSSPQTVSYAEAAAADVNGDSCLYIDKSDAKCAVVKTWLDCTSCSNTKSAYTDTSGLMASNCIAVSDSMDNVIFGITSGNGARSQSITFKNFEATVKSKTPPTIPSFRIWNNTASTRWVKINDGIMTSTCSSSPVVPGEEFTTSSSPLVTGGTLYTYTNRTCTAGTTTTTYANINDPPSKDVNADRCVQISGTGRNGVTDRICPTISCTISATPPVVAYNSATTLNWSILNGPANGTWSSTPGGTCSTLTNSSGGSCNTSPLTTAGSVLYALNLLKTGAPSDINTCSTTVNVGCASYGARNNTGATYRFKRPNGTCVSVANGSNITNTSSVPLSTGQNIGRYASTNTSCSGSPLGSITYDQAMNVDILVNGGNGNCLVYYSSGDTVADR